MACLGPDRKGITSGRRDARSLTVLVVIPARVMQPEGSIGGNQSWPIAHCGYGMAFAQRHRGFCCCWHFGHTSAVCTGSGKPWPDSVGGRGSGRLPGLPSTSTYAAFAALEGLLRSYSRTARKPVSAGIHRLFHRHRQLRALWRRSCVVQLLHGFASNAGISAS